jgi:hypothetical protein
MESQTSDHFLKSAAQKRGLDRQAGEARRPEFDQGNPLAPTSGNHHHRMSARASSVPFQGASRPHLRPESSGGCGVPNSFLPDWGLPGHLFSIAYHPMIVMIGGWCWDWAGDRPDHERQHAALSKPSPDLTHPLLRWCGSARARWARPRRHESSRWPRRSSAPRTLDCTERPEVPTEGGESSSDERLRWI